MKAIYVLIAIPIMTSLLVAAFSWYRYYNDEEVTMRRRQRQWRAYRRRYDRMMDRWYSGR